MGALHGVVMSIGEIMTELEMAQVFMCPNCGKIVRIYKLEEVGMKCAGFTYPGAPVCKIPFEPLHPKMLEGWKAGTLPKRIDRGIIFDLHFTTDVELVWDPFLTHGFLSMLDSKKGGIIATPRQAEKTDTGYRLSMRNCEEISPGEWTVSMMADALEADDKMVKKARVVVLMAHPTVLETTFTWPPGKSSRVDSRAADGWWFVKTDNS